MAGDKEDEVAASVACLAPLGRLSPQCLTVLPAMFVGRRQDRAKRHPAPHNDNDRWWVQLTGQWLALVCSVLFRGHCVAVIRFVGFSAKWTAMKPGAKVRQTCTPIVLGTCHSPVLRILFASSR